MRNECENGASAVWQGVVDGQLRIIESYERDRRRYLVVKPNPDGGATGLTPRQQKALSLRAEGYALKVIAFELAISLPTAARDLKRAMTLLGLQSVAELATVFNHDER